MKYNVGDKVRIKPKNHFCSVDGFNNIHMKDEFFNEYSRLPYCETVMTIGIVNKDFYILKEDKWAYKWTDEMIEGLVEKKISIKLTGEAIKNNEIVVSVDEYILPEGYIIKDENGNVINSHKIVLEKKKEYPKTYEECSLITGYEDRIRLKIIGEFTRLINARNAYWKLYGEEMGLGKPWEPDWKNSEEKRYCIVNIEGDINLPEKVLTKWILKVTNKILVFPTAEMRDAFYEAFKKEIEICKELL